MLPSYQDIEYLNETINDSYIIKQVRKQNKIIQFLLGLLLGLAITGFIFMFFL